jgi:capsular polysaccharide transport system permease protein
VARSTFLDALRVQIRVIKALYRWEVIQRFGRDNLGFIWLFLEPMIFTIAVTTLWLAIDVTHGSQLPVVEFALTGYSTILLWRNCANRCARAIEASAGLLYHRPIRIIDVFITKALVEVVGASISFLGLSILWIAIGWAKPPENIQVVLGGWVMLIWFGGAVAITIGALTSLTDIAERLWHPLAYILFPLSGAGFMVDWLSTDFQRFILWFPMVHCTEMIRDGFFGSIVSTHYDMGYVAMVSLGLTLFALFLVHVAARRVEFR